MNPGIIFLLAVLGGAVCFGAGWLVRGEKDKPVYIPNDRISHDGSTPHIHAHDKEKEDLK